MSPHYPLVGCPPPAFGVKVLGIVTLEDVIEELIGEESALHRIAVLRHTGDAD